MVCGGEVCGMVCVMVSEIVGVEVLVGVFVVLCECYFGLVLELVLSN